MGRLTPIAHYKMNDNAASTAVIDAMGNYAGTYKSVGGNANTADHDVTGKVNNALDFVGDDDYIEVADNAVFSPVLSPFSISAWAYMHDATGFEIICKGVYNTDGEWALRTLPVTDILSFLFMDESEINCYLGRQYGTAITPFENTWIHVAGTYDGGITESGIRLYLNGKQIDDTSYSNGTFAGVENLAHAVWIGRCGTSYANGVIDNIMVFQVELTPGEVWRLYAGGHGTEIPAEGEENRLRGNLRDRNSR
jgi:hypothetical protein